MEKLSGLVQEEDLMDMPPGFRFHPTDEELITHYLAKKVCDSAFFAKAIGEVDMNKIEPWDLPRMAKMGEKEWYFFCLRDKKYPTGLRTNRATAAGYWKATGKDKDIFRGRLLVGMKKTLVFYMGRAPKGEKTNWVIHEYRIEGKLSLQNLPKTAKQNEWVICRVFHKNSGGKKVNFSGLMRMDSGGITASLPPLINSPTPFDSRIINPPISESIHVPCFSNSIDIQSSQKNPINNFINNPIFPFENHSNSILHPFPSTSSFPVHDHAILKGLIDIYGQGLKMETEMITGSQETGVSSEKNMEICSNFGKGKRGILDRETEPSSSLGPVDLDCLWNY